MARKRRRRGSRRRRGHRRHLRDMNPYTLSGFGQLDTHGLQDALLAVASAVGGSLLFGYTLGKLPTTTAGVGGLSAVTGIVGGMAARRWSPSIGDGIAAALGGGGLLILLGSASGVIPASNPANAPVAGLGQYGYRRLGRRHESAFPAMATHTLYSRTMT